MTKKRFTAAERQQIAAGWRTSGMSQPEYAALHGISDRTLREWMARHAEPEAPMDAVRQVLRRTIAELERMLEGLSAADSSAEPREHTTFPSVEPESGSATLAVDADALDALRVQAKPAAVLGAGGNSGFEEIAATTRAAHPHHAGAREAAFLFELEET